MPSKSGELKKWLQFVRREGHILHDYPSLVFQQAINQPDSSSLAQMAQQRLAAAREMRPWFRWINKEAAQSAGILTLVGHKSSVYSCCVSADSRIIVSAGWDGVRVWDFDSGEQVRSQPVLKTRASFVALTPRRLFVGEWDGLNRLGRLQLLDPDTWAHLATLDSPAATQGSFAISADGQWMTASEDNRIGISNLGDGPGPREFEISVSDKINSLSFSANGALLLAVAGFRNVHGWDTTSWAQDFEFKSPVMDLRGAELSSDRQTIALVRPDGVLCYDVATKRLSGVLQGHSGAIEGCCFAPDGSRLLTWARDGQIIIWSVPVPSTELLPLPDEFTDWTTKKSGFQQSKAGSTIVTACSFSPEGSRIATIDTAQGGKLYDGHTFRMLQKIEGLTSYSDLAAKGDFYTACAFSPDGRSFVSGAKTGELTGFPYPHSYGVTDLAFTRDGKWLISVSEDRSFKLWDAATRYLQTSVTAHSAAIHSCSVSPDGGTFATGSEDSTAKVWDLKQPHKPLAVIQHSTAVRSVSYSPDGKQLVCATAGGTLCLWQVDGPVLLKELRICEQNARRCWFTPDAARLIAICEAGAVVVVIDVSTGEVKARFVAGKTLLASTMAPDGLRVFITTKPGAVFLLQLEKGL